MIIKIWEASSIPHNHGDLFEAIITEENGHKLIAQCTSLEAANHIIGLHNAAQQSAQADVCPTCNGRGWYTDGHDNTIKCRACNGTGIRR